MQWGQCLHREAVTALPLEFMLLNLHPNPGRLPIRFGWVKMMCWTLAVNWEAEILRANVPGSDRTWQKRLPAWKPAIPTGLVESSRPADYSCIGSAALEAKSITSTNRFSGPPGG